MSTRAPFPRKSAQRRLPLNPRSAAAKPQHFDRYGLRCPPPPAIALADASGKLLQISDSFAGLLYADRVALLGCQVDELVLGEDWRELNRGFSTLREGRHSDVVLTIRFITREQRARRCLTTVYALRRRDGSVESLLLALNPVGPSAGGILGRPVLMSSIGCG
jgi:hypothetical protein